MVTEAMPKRPIVLWAAAALLAGCQNCSFSIGKTTEQRIEEALGENGFEEVVLSAAAEEDSYTFTGRKGPFACTGTVGVNGNDVSWQGDCREPLPFDVLEPLCNEGDAEACTLAARRLVNGDGVAADGPRSTTMFQAACSAGQPMACFYEGLAYARGDRGVEKNLDTAYARYNTACQGTVAEACHNLASMILDHPSPSEPDKGRVRALLEQNCTETQKLSCGLLGQALADGRHMEADPVRARQLLSGACAASQPRSCGTLGLMMLRGQGGPQDASAGVLHLTRACEANLAIPCAELGRAFLQGTGVPADPDRGRGFLQRACSHGHQGACDMLQGG